jgi:hypothetical protein
VKHKAQKLVALTTVTTAMTVGLLGSSTALADDSSDSVHQITSGVASAFGFGTINVLSGLYTYLQDCENAYSVWVLKTMQGNATQYAITDSQKLQAQTAKDTTAFIFNAVTAPNAQPQATTSTGLPTNYSAGVYAAMVPVNRDTMGLAKSTYLSSEALFASTKYNGDTQRQQAGTFIQFLGDAGARVTPLNAQTLQKADGATAASYLNSLATYYAGQSVGLNALYNLYNERIPVQQLNGESVLSNDQKQVLRRMQPAWTESVSKMTIVDVARETLYTQAEMNYQLFQLRMQLEQLNATLAAMQMEQQQISAKPLLMGKEQQVIQSANAASAPS